MRVDGALEARVIGTVFVGGGAVDAQGVARDTVRAGAFACSVCLSQGTLHRLVLGRQEDDFGVCALGHGLHGFEIADLHGGGRRQDIGLKESVRLQVRG